MNKLDKLIKELYPNGVEYKKINEIANIIRGKRITKKELILDGKYPVISGGIEPMGYYNQYNREENTITIAQYGTAGYINIQKEKFWANDVCYSVYPSNAIQNKFLYYCLMNQQNYIYTLKTEAIPACLPLSKLEDILIPVPPHPVQEEIVRILDNFTELTVELTEKLTAELTARKKQYEYYKEKLFHFDRGIEIKTLENVLKIKNGKDYKHLENGNVPVYGSGGIMTYVDRAIYDKPSVLIPRKGSLNKLYYVDFPFWNVDTIFYTEIDISIVNPKFVYYYLQTQKLERLNKAGGVPSLTQSVLNKVKIPIPSLEEQQRIVDILDRFDKLCNDISEGLPAEIEARQKQYEYYRDKLLTFKPLEEVK